MFGFLKTDTRKENNLSPVGINFPLKSSVSLLRWRKKLYSYRVICLWKQSNLNGIKMRLFSFYMYHYCSHLFYHYPQKTGFTGSTVKEQFCLSSGTFNLHTVILIKRMVPLRKHAYSNVYWKFYHRKIKKNSDNKIWYFPYFRSKHRLWVLVRTASLRRFYWVPTIFCFRRNNKK